MKNRFLCLLFVVCTVISARANSTDPWLEPYADAINGRHKHASEKEAELTNKGKQTLSDLASVS